MDITDTTPQIIAFVNRNENSARLGEDSRSKLRQTQHLTGKVGSDRVPGDLKQELLLAFSELEHHELGLAGAAFFATESGAGVPVL